MLDTCAYIDLGVIGSSALPGLPELTAITLAELQQGVAMAKDPVIRAARMEKPGAAVSDFEALPFDSEAAACYGTLVALVLNAGRDPQRRRFQRPGQRSHCGSSLIPQM